METTQDLNKPMDNSSLENNELREDVEQHHANPEPMKEESCDNNTCNGNTYDEKKSCKCGGHKCLLACNIILLLGLIALYILHFTGIGTPSKHNPNATAPVIAKDGVLKVAYIDSDTLLAKYQYAIDLQEELDKYKDAQERNYQQQMTQFQKDYQNFLQTGETMTLSQQQAKEAELKQRAEKLSTLEAELTNKVLEKQMSSNTELLNRIFAFVREYNADNQQFDIILRKTFTDSPTMYMDSAMDITNEIIQGLNDEYKSVKAKKEKAK